MSDWAIRLPVRCREDTLVDVACSVRELSEPDDRAVARTIAIEAATESGMRTAGELIDHLDAMSRPQRREILNRARISVGLDTVEDAEAHARFVTANETIVRRPRPIPQCVICGSRPTGPGGMPREVPPVRRWHCRDHEAQAQPGDMDPPPSLVNPRTMQLLDPDEDAREQHRDALRAEQERQRLEQREHEAAARRARKAAADERWKPTGRGWTS